MLADGVTVFAASTTVLAGSGFLRYVSYAQCLCPLPKAPRGGVRFAKLAKSDHASDKHTDAVGEHDDAVGKLDDMVGKHTDVVGKHS